MEQRQPCWMDRSTCEQEARRDLANECRLCDELPPGQFGAVLDMILIRFVDC
jgi:hypothetical protein